MLAKLVAHNLMFLIFLVIVDLTVILTAKILLSEDLLSDYTEIDNSDGDNNVIQNSDRGGGIHRSKQTNLLP